MRIRSLVHSPLVALAASFVLWRLAHLFFLHPIFYFWSGEEPSRGTIALDMLHRLPYPWIAYRADEYSGGSIVVGAITAIFFRLFGPTAFALKLTPVLLFTLTLILWYRLIERETDAPTAVAFGLLFTFAPPLLMRYTLTNMGFHSESCFFTALTLWLLFDLHRSGDRPAWEFVALGFVAGFGLWFTYIFALTLAAGSVLWVVRFRRDWSRKDLTLLAGGFVLGFYPWIKANVFGPVNGCFIGEQAVWDHFGFSEFTHSLFCLKTSFPYRWASSFATEDWRLVGFGRPNTVYAILAALLILAWAAGRARGRIFRRPSDLSLLALIYLGIFTLAMQASDFKSPHYRVAAMPFLIFLAASAIREFQQSASMRRRRLAAVALTAFVGAGLFYGVAQFSLLSPGALWHTKGYSRLYVPAALCHSVASCQDYYGRVAPGMDDDDRRDLASGLSCAMDGLWSLNGRTDAIAPMPAGVTTMAPNMFYFVGRFCLYDNLPQWLHIVQRIENFAVEHEVSADQLAGGLRVRMGECPYFFGRRLQTQIQAALRRMPPSRSACYWQGLGYQAALRASGGRSIGPGFADSLRQPLDHVPARYRADFMRGAGVFLFDLWNSNPLHPLWAPEQLAQWEPSFGRHLDEGMAVGWNDYAAYGNPGERRWRIQLLKRRWNPALVSVFEQYEKRVIIPGDAASHA